MAAIFVVTVVTFIMVWVCCKPLKNCHRNRAIRGKEATASRSGDEAYSISMKLGNNEAYWSGDEAILKTGENVAYRTGDEVTSMIGNHAYKSVHKTIVERGSREAVSWSGDEATMKTVPNVAYVLFK